MPAGDGVSLPTTISQMGTVAKVQAQSQVIQTQSAPFSEQLAGKDELQVERIKESDESAEQKLNPDSNNSDKRKRRRLKRKRKELTDNEDEEQESDTDGLGILIDMRA
ncbi:MAG: hypothetical protein ACI9UK_000164 [Candidatus Krumholzibacteriia bacterium]|jgi:hypothetical protein